MTSNGAPGTLAIGLLAGAPPPYTWGIAAMAHALKAAAPRLARRNTSYLMGAMHGIADRYRELGSGTGRVGLNAACRENKIDRGRPLHGLAEVLASEAADIAARCAALDVKRAALKRLEEEN
jgi:hypothetical protein